MNADPNTPNEVSSVVPNTPNEVSDHAFASSNNAHLEKHIPGIGNVENQLEEILNILKRKRD